jgi:hypothetical protein
MKMKPNSFSLQIGDFEARARGAGFGLKKLSQTQIVM